MAVFGKYSLNGVFQSALERRLDSLDLEPEVRAQIEAQRSRLAAAETKDARGRQAIDQACLSLAIARALGVDRAGAGQFPRAWQ